MQAPTTEELLLQIEKLQNRLAEAEQLIELIKAGEVDAFALNKNNKPEVFTLQSGDYAYRVLVENFSEGALNLSEDGLILYSNTAFHETLQLSHEKVIGHHISQFIHPDSKETFNELLIKGLAGQSKGEINLIVGKKLCPVYVSLASLYPNLPTVGVIVSNLTERKQIEKELEVKKNLQNIFLNVPAATSVYEGPDQKYILANKAYEKLTNRKAADLLGKNFRDVFPELKGTGTFELYAHVFKTGEPFIAPEYAAMVDIKNDGVLQQRYFNFSMEPLQNDAKKVYAVITMTYDITEQVEARKKIEESEQRFRKLVQQAPVAMCVFRGENFVFELANEKHLQLIGKTKEQVMNLPVFTAMPEIVGQGYEELLEGVYTKGIPFTANESPLTVIRNGKEEINYVNFVIEPLYNEEHKIDGVFSVATDVTEQVLLRKEVEESEFRYQEMIYSSPSMISILKGKDMIIDIANDAVLASWGKGKDIIGKSLFSVLPEVVEQGFDKLLLNVYKTGDPFYAYETPVTLLRYGINELIYYNFVYQAQRNLNGEVVGVAIIANEVTSQAEINKKIRESEALNRTVLESSPDCIKMLDAEGRLQFMNSNGICLLEIDDFKSVENTYWWDMWEPPNRHIIKDAVATAHTGEKVQLQLLSLTVKGTPKWWDIIVLPVQEEGTDKNHHRILSVSRDITEQKQSELKEKELLARFQTLVLQAPVAICVLRGENYVIEIINESMSELWDRTLEQALNKPVFDVLPELKEQGFKELLVNVYLTGERCVVQELSVNIMRNGKLENAFVKFVYEPLREADGTVSGVMVLAHEITEQVISRKKVEESEKKFEAAILAVNGIIWTNNANGEMMGEQLGWSNLTGQSFEEYQGFGWVKAVHPDDAQPTMEAWNKAVAANSTFEFEHRVKTKQDGWRLFSVKAVPSFDENGAILQWVGVHTDIMEQREAVQKIQESEERFKSIADESPMFVFIVDPDPLAPVSYWNKTWLSYTGQTEEQAAGRAWDGIVHSDDVQVFMDIYNPAYAARQAYFVPAVRIMNVDGIYRWHSFKSNPRFLDNGEFNGYIGVGFDIHEQKLAEEKLAYRTALLEAHNEASVDGLLLIDTRGKILSFNQRFVEIWNIPQDIVNSNDDEAAFSFAMNQLVHPQQFIDKIKYLSEHPTETSIDELEFINGKIVERNGYSVIGEDGTYYAWSWTFKDITERKRIEQDLKETKEQLELTFKNIPAGVYLINAKAEMVYVNDRGAAVYGDFTPEYMLEHKDLSTQLKIADELFERFDENGNYFSGQDSPAYISLTTGKPSQAILKQINKVTRQQRWYYVQGAPLFDERGNVSMVLITSTDITEQKNTEEKIKYSEERFRSLAETLPQMVWVRNGDGEMEYASKNWKEYSGVDDVAEAWSYMIHPDDSEGLKEYWTKVFAEKKGFQHEVRLKNKEGIYRWFYSVGEPVLDADEKVSKWVGSLTDIHEQKLKEERKDEFISIASHELKTPLTTAKAYLQMLELYLDENNEEAALYVKKANQAVNRLNELIGELLDVSKISFGKIIYTISTFNFNDMVNSTVENIQLISPRHTIIKTGKVYDEVTGDKDRLQQVVINLLTNAIKYSPGSDKVFITLEQQNDMINVSVRDTGIGIAKQSLYKIFEKYHRIDEHAVHFQGLGIGLYISYEIIKRHHGKLWAESEPGIGSIFYFSLPVRHVESGK